MTVNKTILRFPNYTVSDKGKIFSRKRDQFLKPYFNTKGYLIVKLSHNAHRMTYPIHRLVLEAFVGLRPNNMQCRHLDGNKYNNSVDNLTWGTAKENTQDSIRMGTFHYNYFTKKSLQKSYETRINNLSKKQNKLKPPSTKRLFKLNNLQLRIILRYPRCHRGNLWLANIFNVSIKTIECVRCNRYVSSELPKL